GSNGLRAMALELEMVLAHARRLQRADHTYSDITVPVTVTPSSRRSAAGCPKLFQLASRKGVTSFNYETSLVRSRANSWSVIDPDFLSRSSFSISSATLKPTTPPTPSHASSPSCLLRP